MLPIDDTGPVLRSELADLELPVAFSDRGVQLGDETAQLELVPDAIASPTVGPCLGQRRDSADCPRTVTFPTASGLSWWQVGPASLQWGWEVDTAPLDGADTLVLRMAVSGASDVVMHGNTAVLVDRTGHRWEVSAPVSWDAQGRGLASQQVWVDGELVVEVDISGPGVRFPVTVDPVLSSATTTLAPGTAGFGEDVVWMGDVDADGYDDLAVATGGQGGNLSGAGFVSAFMGSVSGVQSTAGLVLISTRASERFGEHLAAGGDLNDDGYDDLIVRGRLGTSTGIDHLYIFHGSSSGLGSSPQTTLSDASRPTFGGYLGGRGDLDGDGYADLVAGGTDPTVTSGPTSRAYVHHGTSTGVSSTVHTTLLSGLAELALDGDLDGDGYSDLALGVPYDSPGGIFYQGGLRVHLGSVSGVGSSVDGEIQGAAYRDQLGQAVAYAGDVDADGFDDLIVSAWHKSSAGLSRNGEVYVVHGAATGIDPTLVTVMVGDLNGGYVGRSLAGGGDVNSDGYDDVLIGTSAYRTSHQGAAWLYLGGTTGVGGRGLSGADDSWFGTSSHQFLGEGVTIAGDGNGDGFSDAVVGGGGIERVYVYHGYEDADGDGVIVGGEADDVQDCDDTDGTVGGPTSWYNDADGDGDGQGVHSEACDAPSGTVATETDCDDSDAAIGEATWEYTDYDRDGYGVSTLIEVCPSDPGWATNTDDCNDRSASVNPAGQEVCDRGSSDEDCDGLIDDADPSVDTSTMSTFYADTDGDGYGDPSNTTQQCDASSGWLGMARDCDDTDAAIGPQADEVCDAADVDEDCDGVSDDDDSDVEPSTMSTFYIDVDGDGHGDVWPFTSACDVPSGYTASSDDCDDTRADVSPSSTEVCDASDVDEDCDGLSDDDDTSVDSSTWSIWYADTDADSYGDPYTTVQACDEPSGHVADNTDCDDTRADVSPAAQEKCDSADDDEDCDGLGDDDDSSVATWTQTTWYIDGDGDGFGDAASSIDACNQPSGHVTDDTDCDDTRATVAPGLTEVCDALDLDEDCDGDADDNDSDVDTTTLFTWYPDADDDSYGNPDGAPLVRCDMPAGFVIDSTDCDDTRADVSPDGLEVCDSVNADEDCNGVSDDDDPGVDPSTLTTTWTDEDEDGYGAPGTEDYVCDWGVNRTLNNTDCDDTRADVRPDASEECDPDRTDEDCNGLADDDDDGVRSSGFVSAWPDEDADGYGNPEEVWRGCHPLSDHVDNDEDCDDSDPATHPGADEPCEGIDRNCDGVALTVEECVEDDTAVVEEGPTEDSGPVDDGSSDASKSGCSTTGGAATTAWALVVLGARRRNPRGCRSTTILCSRLDGKRGYSARAGRMKDG